MDAGNTTAELYRKIGEATSDAVIFADRDGLIRLWNRGAELIFGYPAGEALGQRLDLIIPDRLRSAHWDAFHRSLQTGQTKYTDRVLTTRSVHKNGSKLYVDLGFGLVKDANGIAVGAFAIGRDCTGRYLADAALKARIRELEARIDTAPPKTCS
jgi:PAS domain S-box-containing protein